MAKVVVAHTPILNNELGDLTVHVGQQFPVIEEPRNFMELLIFAKLDAQNDLENSILVDFGEGFVVFSVEPDEQGRTIKKWFDIKEVA